MTILVNQPWGLGDIIFTQTLIRRIADGRPIVWPVFPQFAEGLNRAYPDIKFVDWQTVKLDYKRAEQYEIALPEYGLCTVIPICHAHTTLGVEYKHCMRAKYDLYGLKWEEWTEQAMWQRDKDHEIILCQTLDTSVLDPKYTLVNRIFGSDSQLKANISVQGIEMSTMPPLFGKQISLFDWAGAIEQVGFIHTVSTSIIYLLEMLELKAKEIHLYVRKPIEQDFRNVDYLLRRHKYILHL